MPSGSRRDAIVWFLLWVGRETGGIARYTDPSRFRSLLERDCQERWDENVVEHPQHQEAVDLWLEFFEWIGRSEVLSPPYTPSEYDEAWGSTWLKAFNNPTKLGLLRLLGRLASFGHVNSIILVGMLDLNSFPEPQFRLAALLVRLTQPILTAADANDLAVAAAVLLALEPPAANQGPTNSSFGLSNGISVVS
jgi:hypothetical protein